MNLMTYHLAISVPFQEKVGRLANLTGQEAQTKHYTSVCNGCALLKILKIQNNTKERQGCFDVYAELNIICNTEDLII